VFGSRKIDRASTNTKAEICGYLHKLLSFYQPAEERELSGFSYALLTTLLQLLFEAGFVTIETMERHFRETEESFSTSGNRTSGKALRLARKAEDFLSSERGGMFWPIHPHRPVFTGCRTIGSQQLSVTSMGENDDVSCGASPSPLQRDGNVVRIANADFLKGSTEILS